MTIDFVSVLRSAVQKNASDIHIVIGRPPMLRVRGESMIDDHLCDGDYVVIERRESARNGEQVVALLDTGEATLKRFYKEPGNKIRLQPANSSMAPRVVASDRVRVQGVVIGVLRSYLN